MRDSLLLVGRPLWLPTAYHLFCLQDSALCGRCLHGCKRASKHACGWWLPCRLTWPAFLIHDSRCHRVSLSQWACHSWADQGVFPVLHLSSSDLGCLVGPPSFQVALQSSHFISLAPFNITSMDHGFLLLSKQVPGWFGVLSQHC